MTERQTPIDVTPTDVTSLNQTSEYPAFVAAPVTPQQDGRHIPGQGRQPARPKSRLGGLLSVVIGCLCVLLGIPMLVLPGPGLVAIAGGAFLVFNGCKRAFGRREQDIAY